VVLEKDGEDQSDRLCEKRRSIKRVKEEKNILLIIKEGNLTGLVTYCVGTAF
jgi:hypothetical protein